MKYLAFFITTLAVLLAPVMASSPAFAYDPFQNVCNNQAGSSSAVCSGKPSDSSQNPLTGRNGLIRGIANIIAIIAGIAAVILIIIAGFKYVTSGGDAAKTKSAKDTIVSAVIGLVIIALADAIISFVIGRI